MHRDILFSLRHHIWQILPFRWICWSLFWIVCPERLLVDLIIPILLEIVLFQCYCQRVTQPLQQRVIVKLPQPLRKSRIGILFYSGYFSIGKHIIGLKTIWKKLTGKIFTHRKYIFRLWIKRLLVLVQKVSTTYISKKISSFLFYNNFVWLLATPFWEAFTQGFSEKGSEHDLRTCL